VYPIACQQDVLAQAIKEKEGIVIPYCGLLFFALVL
jgi:hypothetical protein